MTKSGLLLLSAVCGFLSTTYAALIDPPPGGVEELSQVLLKQLHRDVDLRLFHCTSGPNYRYSFWRFFLPMYLFHNGQLISFS